MDRTQFEGWDNPQVQALLKAAQEAYPHIRFRGVVSTGAKVTAPARLHNALAEALRRKERRHDRD